MAGERSERKKKQKQMGLRDYLRLLGSVWVFRKLLFLKSVGKFWKKIRGNTKQSKFQKKKQKIQATMKYRKSQKFKKERKGNHKTHHDLSGI